MAECYWASLLDLAWGCGAQHAPVPGSVEQKQIVQVLLRNEFERLQHLSFAEAPRAWSGTGELSEEALSFLDVWRNDAIQMASRR